MKINSKLSGLGSYAFTRMEAVFVGVAMFSITLVIVLKFSFERPKNSTITCVSNLKLLGLGFRMYSSENEGLFPMGVPVKEGGTFEFVRDAAVGYRHFQALSNHAPDYRIIHCPQDSRVSPPSWNWLNNANLSYFVGLNACETNPGSFLAGDRNLSQKSQVLVEFSQHESVQWHQDGKLHTESGNILFGDGHVETIISTKLSNIVDRARQASNPLLFFP